MAINRVKKKDMVVVISGKDKGKRGEVLQIDPCGEKVLVKGVAIVTRHLKARRSGEKPGIRKQESFIHTAKTMVVCPSCDKPSRVGCITNDKGVKSRLCKECQAIW